MTRQVELGPDTDAGTDTGALTVRTDVTGKAARTGHRLVLGFDLWRATVSLRDEAPVAVDLNVEVDSLQVRSGEGGLTPMTAPERGVARLNALKSLKAAKFGQVTFVADAVTPTDAGYRLSGQLTICGTTKPHTVEVTSDGASVQGESVVTQTDFGVKPYSLMMGALKVADDVIVALETRVPDASGGSE